jgi:hypothetical protein
MREKRTSLRSAKRLTFAAILAFASPPSRRCAASEKTRAISPEYGVAVRLSESILSADS